jgi:hypothetical protein
MHSGMTSQATSQTTQGLFFRPVHPLNFPCRELISETEEPARSWPDVTRVIELYEDEQGLLQLMVCFRSARQPGHIDNVRCYVAGLGARSGADVQQLLQRYPDAGGQCERQMIGVLSKLHGDPVYK